MTASLAGGAVNTAGHRRLSHLWAGTALTAPAAERLRSRFDDGTEEVIGALIEVHRTLGPGLLESTYEACLVHELTLRGLRCERQKPLAVRYKGLFVECGYRLDLLVEDRILIELKAVERLLPIHTAQVLTYLKLSEVRVGLLVNFNVRVLKDGLRRLWTTAQPFLPPPLPVPSSSPRIRLFAGRKVGRSLSGSVFFVA
jgi:GxxExxY protein